ncbi:MAG TPA: DEAD/DEAH box helicase [Gammaproteobacteria bacterium]|nr:DEAD/DEAH box helicase [Gammaproteobacteria bacterium]
MVFADIHDGKIAVISEYREKDLIKLIPGARFNGNSKTWTTPISWAACVQLRGVFGNQLEIGPELWLWAENERNNRINPALEIHKSIHMIDNGSPGAELIKSWRGRGVHDLYPYQEAAAQFLARAGSALIADEPGTGKTASALSGVRLFHEMFKSGLPALVVCPNTVKRHWAAEAEMWLPEAHPYVVSGTATEKRKILKAAKSDPFALVIMNFEAIRLHSKLSSYGNIRLKKSIECDPSVYNEEEEEKYRAAKISLCETHHKELNGFGFKTAILDEAHRVKEPKAKQTRAIWATLHDPTIQRRWALTGTPIADDLADLWAVYHAIAPEDAPVKSKFLDRYALMTYNAMGFMEIMGLNPQTKDEMFAIIDPRFRRMTKDIVLPWLPDKVYQQITVEMTPKQKKAYAELSEGLYTRTADGGIIVAPTNVVSQTRLLQLASSYCEVEKSNPNDPKTWVVRPTNPSPKVEALIELILDAKGKSIAVVAEQKKLLELAAEHFEKEHISYAMITGDVNEYQRALNLENFQSGKIQVLCFTYAAGGVGLNMTQADTLVRLQISWSLVSNLQAVDRVHRPGAEKHESINIIDITTVGTVEEEQRKDFIEKQKRLEQIVRDRQRRMERGVAFDDLNQEESMIMQSQILGGPYGYGSTSG